MGVKRLVLVIYIYIYVCVCVCVCVCVYCRTGTWQGMYTAFDGAYLIGVTTQMTCIKSANVV